MKVIRLILLIIYSVVIGVVKFVGFFPLIILGMMIMVIFDICMFTLINYVIRTLDKPKVWLKANK